jgi:hypothetical protein
VQRAGVVVETEADEVGGDRDADSDAAQALKRLSDSQSPLKRTG